MDYTELTPQQEVHDSGLVYDIHSLFAVLKQVTDQRHAKGKIYPLITLLVLVILAKLSGANNPSEITEWVKNHADQLVEWKILPTTETPCHMTFRRLLQFNVTPEELEKLIGEYHRSQLRPEEDLVYTMDGKTVRGTIPQGETQGTHLLSVYAPSQGLVLVEAEVGPKENEIVVAPKVLEQVDLKGVTVIGDAMHTQRAVSEQILDQGGNYIWIVKGNQARTEWAIQKLFTHEACNLQMGATLSKEIRVASHVNKGHGRREKRTLWATSQLNDYIDWPGLQQAFRLERIVWHGKQQRRTREVVYGITGLSPQKASPQQLLQRIRRYWGIENGLHHRRDVTLHEDATRLTVGHSGHIMAIFNNIVIALCFRHNPNIAQARRFFNAKPVEALKLILGTPDLLSC
jgi:predicted transposase YbfD/YdcC